ncbi:unnamed protein product [Caenorhabditis angaria]|uniref:PDZ domain-containing protein n=1 Tax=Caenorhabditis angaria TaxID=860376 RepID=A0A9P1I4K2_9PELO|nr:unnamed protein product [Caenorhabditis angaria]
MMRKNSLEEINPKNAKIKKKEHQAVSPIRTTKKSSIKRQLSPKPGKTEVRRNEENPQPRRSLELEEKAEKMSDPGEKGEKKDESQVQQVKNNEENAPDPSYPPNRDKNIKEKDRKAGFDYIIVNIPNKPGTKFGLAIKNVSKTIFVQKVEDNSIVGGLLLVSDRIIDIEGIKVEDNLTCKNIIVKALKEKGGASLLIERPLTENAKKMAMDEMNEEYNQSIIVTQDVRDIMKKMEQKIQDKPVTSALKTTNTPPQSDRRPIILEEGHKSIMIEMDDEENATKLHKVVRASNYQ